MDKIAFLFAGQGAQYPGMGRELYESSTAARRAFDLAERERPGTIEQCFNGSDSELAITENTQPCLFIVDYACAAALHEAGVMADGAAGFSLGEVAAAAFCDLIDLKTAFRLVCERARLMQAASEKKAAAMSAVLRLDAETVETLAGKYPCVFVANYNCPGQTVVSGEISQLEAFEAEVHAQRGRAVRLKVGGGFHSPFMSEASAGLLNYMDSLSFAPPRIPLYANLNAEPYGDAKSLLSEQVMRPVYWQSSIEAMQRDGYTIFIEVGAGKTLTGLMGKIGGAKLCVNVENAGSLKSAVSAVKALSEEAGIC